MGEGGDGLQLDGVHVLEGSVEDTWSVENLPAGISMVHVANEDTLGCESIRLDLHISTCHQIHEGRFT